MNETNQQGYFIHRQINSESYYNYKLPEYISQRLPLNKNANIFDYGCGYGQIISAIQRAGYNNVTCYDIEPSCIAHCKNNGLNIITSDSLYKIEEGYYDFIIVSHVLEHIPKDKIISTLNQIKRLLSKDGQLLVCVPNAQSNTGCYWAYEDFTHNTIFTSGSLYYVLSKSGYTHIEFIDLDCTEGMQGWRKIFRTIMLGIYKFNYKFWNWVTGSSTHKPSQDIFTYEIKAIARK